VWVLASISSQAHPNFNVEIATEAEAGAVSADEEGEGFKGPFASMQQPSRRA